VTRPRDRHRSPTADRIADDDRLFWVFFPVLVVYSLGLFVSRHPIATTAAGAHWLFWQTVSAPLIVGPVAVLAVLAVNVACLRLYRRVTGRSSLPGGDVQPAGARPPTGRTAPHAPVTARRIGMPTVVQGHVIEGTTDHAASSRISTGDVGGAHRA
jgi:hypothetical protein